MTHCYEMLYPMPPPGSDEAETLRAELAAAHERLGDAERLAGTVAALEGELSFLRKVSSLAQLSTRAAAIALGTLQALITCLIWGSVFIASVDHSQAPGLSKLPEGHNDLNSPRVMKKAKRVLYGDRQEHQIEMEEAATRALALETHMEAAQVRNARAEPEAISSSGN